MITGYMLKEGFLLSLKEFKKCSRCLEDKSYKDFDKLKLGKDGLNPVCKKCRLLSQKTRRQ